MKKNLKIKELPLGERPYEKLEKYGPEALSNAELLAIIIRTGNRNETSISLAQRVLMQDDEGRGPAYLHGVSLEQLRTIKGIGKVKAIQIKAVMEFSKRVASTFTRDNKVTIESSMDVSKLLMEDLRHLKKEVFKAILLNTKRQVIRQIDISVGSLNASFGFPNITLSATTIVSAPNTIPFSTFCATFFAFANADFSALSQGSPDKSKLFSSISLGKTKNDVFNCFKSILRRGEADAKIIFSINFYTYTT